MPSRSSRSFTRHAAASATAALIILSILPPASAGERGAVGDLYVCNQIRHNVLQYDGMTGEYVGQFVRTRIGGLEYPSDLVWGPDGHLYVISGGTHSVLKYDGSDGHYLGEFVPPRSGGLEWPNTLTFGGPEGNLYVYGEGAEAVWEFDGQTGGQEEEGRVVLRLQDHGLANPECIKFGPNGNLFITDLSVCCATLYEFEMVNGEFEFVREVITLPNSGKEGFIYEPQTNTWLACSADVRIDRYGFDGEFLETIIEGVHTREPFILNTPWDLAYGPSGNLFVVGTRTLINEEEDLDTGAVHEYRYNPDTETYDQMRVFGYPEEGQPTDDELRRPLNLEFKPLPGDYGGDHAGGDWDVDIEDCEHLFAHLSGPRVRINDARALIAFDVDHDRDIDLRDFAAFQISFAAGK